ncbi:unnamed protein product [Mesocestoides corti]|nr:unnamed protein product [Mesocestoides corti]
MAAFQKAFSAIDTDNSGVITISQLKTYMRRMNYKESFVTTWISLFDPENTGLITYKQYCDVLGLKPSETHPVETTKPMKQPVPGQSANLEASPPNSPSDYNGLQPEHHEAENNATIAPVCVEGTVDSFDETDGSTRQQSAEPVEMSEEPIHSSEVPRVESKPSHGKKGNTNSLDMVEPESSTANKRRSRRKKSSSKSAEKDDVSESAGLLRNDEKPGDVAPCGSDEVIRSTEVNQLEQTPPHPDHPHHDNAEAGETKHPQKPTPSSKPGKTARQKQSSSSEKGEQSGKSKKASRARRRTTNSSTHDEPFNQTKDVHHTDGGDENQPADCASAVLDENSNSVHHETMEIAPCDKPIPVTEKGSKKPRKRNAKSFGGTDVSPALEDESSRRSEGVSPSFSKTAPACHPKNKKNKGEKKNANSTSVEAEGSLPPEAIDGVEMEPAATGSVVGDADLVVEETLIQPVEGAPVTEADVEFTDAKSPKRRKTGSTSADSECGKSELKESVGIAPSETLESTHIPDVFDLLMELKEDDLMPDIEEVSEPVVASTADEISTDNMDVHKTSQEDTETMLEPSANNDVEMTVVEPVLQETSLQTPPKENPNQVEIPPISLINQPAEFTCPTTQSEDLTKSESTTMDEEPCVCVEEVSKMECGMPTSHVEPLNKEPFIEPVLQPVQSATPDIASVPDEQPLKTEVIARKKSPTKKASTKKEKSTKTQPKTPPVVHQTCEQQLEPAEDLQATRKPPQKSNRPTNKPQSAKTAEASKKRKTTDTQTSAAVVEAKIDEKDSQRSQTATVATPDVEMPHAVNPPKAQVPKKDVAKEQKAQSRQTKSSNQSQKRKEAPKSS